MNRECYGDWLPALELYRCLGDGTFHQMTEAPDFCHNCKRPAVPVTQDPVLTRKVVSYEVKIDSFGWLPYQQEEHEV
jgi:hypothetical protein